ncbi:hypothetical protein ANANG_G00151410 [Anguilla anguilla]|uniref:Uncharacterized protein n=1 Tax=Anguilla anguilla TaxID=7936 RepID=A0A9D3M9S7_ANGAN|nr:hypothetical protein ANANG_G00151410 [Anguilla anguilla]
MYTVLESRTLIHVIILKMLVAKKILNVPVKNRNISADATTTKRNVVGVAVHCVHHSRKKGPAASVESSKTQKVDPNPSSSKKESSPMDDYSNLVFASDLQNGQKPQPASRSPHDSIPMASQPYSAYRNPSYRNPYASSQPSRNPYSSLDRYDGYKNPIEPPGLQNSVARGNQSGYQQAGPPTPLYSSPDYDSSRPQFPRVQIGRQ